jgi:flagellar protein FliS
MLMDGALEGIANAKGAISRKDHDQRHQNITWTMTVIDALRGALDFEQGGEIAANLDSLYDYINRRLLDANMQNDSEPLDEVSSLLREIKGAWDAMPESLRNASDIEQAAKDL